MRSYPPSWPAIRPYNFRLSHVDSRPRGRSPYKSNLINTLIYISNISGSKTNDVSTVNNEEKLNSIASSFPPFPLEPDVKMDSDSELSHSVASNSLSFLKALSEPTSREFVDNPRLDVVKTKNSKRKIVEKESPPVSTGVGGESRGRGIFRNQVRQSHMPPMIEVCLTFLSTLK